MGLADPDKLVKMGWSAWFGGTPWQAYAPIDLYWTGDGQKETPRSGLLDRIGVSADR